MKPAPANYIGSMADEGKVIELFNLTEDIALHPKNSTSRETLVAAGFAVPAFHVCERMIKGQLFKVSSLTRRGLALRRVTT